MSFKAKSKTIHKKFPGVQAVVERIKTPGTVDVGLIDTGPHADSPDYTVAMIGFVHEFGSDDGRTPERSFIRSTTTDSKKEIISLQKQALKQITLGKLTVPKALGLIGEFLSGKIKEKITAIDTPPNSPATIAKKKSSNPLIDTSQMRNSITYEVNK